MILASQTASNLDIKWRIATDLDLYDQYLADNNGHVLQSATWGEALAHAKEEVITQQYLFAETTDSKLVACVRLENRYSILGKVAWIPEGPTIASTTVKESHIRKSLLSHLRNHGYVAIFNNTRNISETPTMRCTSILDLTTGPEVVIKNLHRDIPYSHRKCDRENIKIFSDPSAFKVSQFSEIVKQISNSKGFEFPAPPSIFDKLLNRGHPSLGKPWKTTLYLAEKDQEVLGGALIVSNPREANYLFGAVKQGTKFRIGAALQWHIINELLRQGIHRYDLNGMDRVNNPGVYSFKEKLGGDLTYLQDTCVEAIRKRGKILAIAYQITQRF